MKSIIILIVLCSITHFIHAQNSSSPYDHTNIYLKKGGFEKDGKTIRYGIFKKHLKQELSASPMAYAELKRSRNNNLVVVGCTLVSAILTVSGTQRVFVKKELNYSGLGFNLLSIPFKIKSKNHINRAVWLYNRDVMSKK